MDDGVVEVVGQAQLGLATLLRDFALLALDVTLVLDVGLDLQRDLLRKFLAGRVIGAACSLFTADNTVFGVITNQRGCNIITGTTVKKAANSCIKVIGKSISEIALF